MKPLPFLPLDSWTVCGFKSTVSYSDIEHINCAGKPYPNSASHCHWPGTITKPSEIHSTVLSCWLHQDNRSMVRSVNSRSISLLQNAICCEVSSLMKTMVCGIPWSYRHSVSLWMVVFAQALNSGKTNLYPEDVFIPIRTVKRKFSRKVTCKVVIQK